MVCSGEVRNTARVVRRFEQNFQRVVQVEAAPVVHLALSHCLCVNGFLLHSVSDVYFEDVPALEQLTLVSVFLSCSFLLTNLKWSRRSRRKLCAGVGPGSDWNGSYAEPCLKHALGSDELLQFR